MRRALWVLGIGSITALVALWLAYRTPNIRHLELGSAPFTALEVERGEYVFRLAGCQGCHTDDDQSGAFLAGGRPMATAFGTFYTPNITPDRDTGIGTWSIEDFARSLHYGVAPTGHRYYPVFPYTSYTEMNATDIRVLYAYLQTVPAVNRKNQDHQTPWYLPRLALIGWRSLYFSPGTYTPKAEHDAIWNRGAYLVRALGHCGECHTPRNGNGAMIRERFLTGTEDGPDGDEVPNVTASSEHLGDWYAEDLDYFLESGMLPDGDFVSGSMAEVIDHSLIHLTAEDRQAMTHYLLNNGS